MTFKRSCLAHVHSQSRIGNFCSFFIVPALQGIYHLQQYFCMSSSSLAGGAEGAESNAKLHSPSQHQPKCRIETHFRSCWAYCQITPHSLVSLHNGSPQLKQQVTSLKVMLPSWCSIFAETKIIPILFFLHWNSMGFFSYFARNDNITL